MPLYITWTRGHGKNCINILSNILAPLSGNGDYINRCTSDKCQPSVNQKVLRANRDMQQAAIMDGLVVQIIPDVAFVRVKMGGSPEEDLAYTMISNKSYTRITSMIASEKPLDRRDFKEDTQTVVRWLEGTYPDFFYVVDLDDIEAFFAEYNTIDNRHQYEMFVAKLRPETYQQ